MEEASHADGGVVESRRPAAARDSRSEISNAVYESTPIELSVDEARRRVVDSFAPLPSEERATVDALNAVLAEALVAPIDLPVFTNAAMDGYAVRSSDLGWPETSLPIATSIAAGDALGFPLPAASAARIMTGAPLPAGADAVVPFERTTLVSPAVVQIHDRPHPGTNVRWAGEHVRAGDVLLPAGTRIGPVQIALLSAVGLTSIRTHRRPRVAVLATGDEIVEPGNPLQPGQIWDANSASIVAMLADLGAVPVRLGIARDDSPDLVRRLEPAAALGVDLLITSGGVSAGDFDLVKQVLRDQGEVEVWSVRMKPGRPLAFGRIGLMPVLGLPGNPVAAMVAFLQFARPAILTMLGVDPPDLHLPEIAVTVLDAIDNPGHRRSFVRVAVSATAAGFEASLAGPQGSSDVVAFARANGLLVIPEEVERVEPGMRLMAQMPGWTLD